MKSLNIQKKSATASKTRYDLGTIKYTYATIKIQYIVITQNYNIDIVTEWEPTIEILNI